MTEISERKTAAGGGAAGQGPAPAARTRPRSAVSEGLGLVGLAGLLGATFALVGSGMPVGWQVLVITLALVVPMLLWSAVVEREYLNPSAGLDFASPRPLAAALSTTATKLVGLWGTWAVIAALYLSLRNFSGTDFDLYFAALIWLAPVLVVGSIPYVLFVDRRMIEPRDALWHAGRWFMGRPADPEMVREHARCWAIKGLFLALMAAGMPGQVAAVTGPGWDAVFADGVRFAIWLIDLSFLADVAFAMIGYVFTTRLLDAHIRSANPYASAWVYALVCYPPFILMGTGGPLDYRGPMVWVDWLRDLPVLLYLWAAALVALTGLYAWATVIFGLRFSNLTHRGILTNGPYRFFKHPAYLAKNLFWWMVFMPVLSPAGPLEALRNVVLLLIVNLIYYMRAKSEEWHLMADPAYRDYAAWIDEHGVIPRLRRGLAGLLFRR